MLYCYQLIFSIKTHADVVPNFKSFVLDVRYVFIGIQGRFAFISRLKNGSQGENWANVWMNGYKKRTKLNLRRIQAHPRVMSKERKRFSFQYFEKLLKIYGWPNLKRIKLWHHPRTHPINIKKSICIPIFEFASWSFSNARSTSLIFKYIMPKSVKSSLFSGETLWRKRKIMKRASDYNRRH